MEEAKISAWQFFLLVLNFTLGTTIFFKPGAYISAAEQDAWLVPIWSGVAGILMVCLWLNLAKHYPGLSIIQISMKAAGNKFGALLALFYVWFFIHTSSLILRSISLFMNSTLMPHTPITVFHGMFLIIVSYATVKGIEVIARVSEIFTPIILILTAIFLSITLKEWNWERFEPMLQLDVWKSMKDSRSSIAFPYMEVICFMMIFPFVKNRLKASLISAILLATMILSIVTFLIIGVSGVTRISHHVYPLYTIAQEMHIGQLFEHLEAIIAIVWMITIFSKLTVAYYCSVLGICQLFQLTNRKWVAISLIVLISGIASTNHENIVEQILWDKRYNFEHKSLYSVVLPMLLLILTWLRKSGQKQKDNSA
ncbi:MAG: germination protein [Paenibacillus sp.]|jgi:spore germination protein KB|nr:germination protein [Paenibacillus sp.]